MREDSPVLAALKGATKECRRPGCKNTYFILDPFERFTSHRFSGYCSQLCHQKARRAHTPRGGDRKGQVFGPENAENIEGVSTDYPEDCPTDPAPHILRELEEEK